MSNITIPARHTVVRLLKRPVGEIVPGLDLVPQFETTPTLSAFQVKNEDDEEEQQVLVHRLYLSLDPAMRGWMRDLPSYIPPVRLGDVMRGMSICEVIETSNSKKGDNSKFNVGDLVQDNSINGGWDEYSIVSAKRLRKLDPLPASIPLTAHLSVLGITGMTAYFGLLEIGKPKRGETILVSAAAGATGSVVCQMAKHVIGCKVIGIAGGSTKCRWLQQEIGCDAVIDYKVAQNNPKIFQQQLRTALQEVNSKGFDIFFDNVGGMILNETLRRLNVYGRVVLCGAISGYNVDDPRSSKVVPPTNYMALISLRAKIQGFIVTDYVRQYKQAKQNIIQWIQEGKIKYKEDVRVEGGLQQAPYYLKELFHGTNTGKLIVKVDDPIIPSNQQLLQQQRQLPQSRL